MPIRDFNPFVPGFPPIGGGIQDALDYMRSFNDVGSLENRIARLQIVSEERRKRIEALQQEVAMLEAELAKYKPQQDELLPCPFCGCEDISVQKADDARDEYPYWVECDSCFSQTQYFTNEESARNKWNKRVK